MSEVIRGFQDLTSVVVHGIPLDFEDILHLATLQNPKTLHANSSDEIKQDDFQYLTSTSASDQVYFPSLQKIDLKNRFLAFCTSILKVVSSPVLDAVTFTTTQASITVTVNSVLIGDHLTRKTFGPLLAISNLSVLDINIAHMIEIDNAFLVDMALAWRKLVRLEFCVEHPYWD